jgi:nicotinamidase-related amidase
VANQEHDYFVLKPKHSAFYQTPLDILLKHLGARRLILIGLCTNSCVVAIGQIKTILKADVCLSQRTLT